jgi:hypothetical protein
MLYVRKKAAGHHESVSLRLVAAATALIFILTLPPEVKAQVTQLACSGTLRVIRAGISSPEEPWTFALIIDIDKKTVTVDDYEPVQLFGDSSQNTVAFMPSTPSNFGVSTGTLNRITGEASIHIIRDGLRIMRGICESARKLF